MVVRRGTARRASAQGAADATHREPPQAGSPGAQRGQHVAAQARGQVRGGEADEEGLHVGRARPPQGPRSTALLQAAEAGGEKL